MADYDGFVVHRWEFDSPREHQFMLSIRPHHYHRAGQSHI